MIVYEEIVGAQDFIVKEWGDAGKQIVVACLYENPFNKPFKEFLDHCMACGGNWGGMLLSGINELYPKVYSLIPHDMGVNAFACICNTLILLGVDTSV